jgi:hypothetical protein
VYPAIILIDLEKIMSRPCNPALCVGFLLALAGCGGGGSASNPVAAQPPTGANTPTALLTNAKSQEELLTTFRSSYAATLDGSRQSDDDGVALTASAEDAGSGSGSSGFSVTYTAENTVDEYDAVKYDGEYLYIAPSRSMDRSCCFVSLSQPAVGMAASGSETTRSIRVLRTTPADAGVVSMAEISLDQDVSVEGLYQQQDRLLALTATNWRGVFGDQPLESWQGESTGLRLYDLTDPANPAQLTEVRIEGVLLTSRKTSSGVHIVSRHSPTIDGLAYGAANAQEKADNQTLLENLDWNSLLPRVLENGDPIDLFSTERCFSIDGDHPLAPAQLGYPTVTSIITVDPQSGVVTDGLCYLEYSDGAYFSADALFLTQVDYDSASDGYRTYVHRFDLAASLSYAGSGRVDGALFLGGQSDFRISADGEHLRLVTTQYTGDSADRLDHSIYVLQVDGSEKELIIVGQIPNSTRSEEIGKPNEDLYGVRFVGSRAYLVTFERTDPLYTIDLSDPTDPYIVGALEVTGFSNFLHPVNDDLLLGLGQSEDNEVKLELFDISDFDTPRSQGVLTLGRDLAWGFSAAEYDRRAFSYLAGDTTDRFTVPLSGYSEGANSAWRERLQLLEIRNKDQAAAASLVDVGYLSVTGLEADEYPSDRSRGVISGDAVYFINGTNVFSSLWDDPFNQVGPR